MYLWLMVLNGLLAKKGILPYVPKKVEISSYNILFLGSATILGWGSPQGLERPAAVRAPYRG